MHERLLAVVQETMEPAQVSLWLRPWEQQSTEQEGHLETRRERSISNG